MSSGTDGACERCGSSRHYTRDCGIRAVEEAVGCRGCGYRVDPSTCWCGESWALHSERFIEHSFVPIGCECARAKEVQLVPPPEVHPSKMSDDRFLAALSDIRGR